VITEQCLEVLELLFTGAVHFAVERGSDAELARARELLRVMAAHETEEAAYLFALDELMQLVHSASGNLVLRLVQNGLRSLFVSRPEWIDTRPPREQLLTISRALDRALARRDAASAQEGARRLVRAQRERLLKALEAERATARRKTSLSGTKRSGRKRSGSNK
jgi:DNA-binding FadR family transcriptional regulator